MNQNDRISIVMIGHKRIPSREGGVEIVVNELSKRIAALGNDVTVYNRKGNHVSGKKYNKTHKEAEEVDKTESKINIKEILTIDKRGLAAVTSSFFATLAVIYNVKLKRKKYDCIHYHAEGPSVMVRLANLFGIRTVVTIHGLDWQRAKWGGFAIKYLKFGEKMAAKYADEVIVLSQNVKEYFMSTYNRETVFIPNGISKPNVIEANLIYDKWKLEKDSYILYLGRIVPEKGSHYLIEAFKEIDTDKKLVIAGGASDTLEYYENVQNMAKSDSRIILLDFVQGEILQELYSNAYIYCLPSDLEGMPLSLLEAMSYGNCCIVSDIPECTEVVKDKGLSFPKSNVKELSKLLQSCINDKLKVNKYKNESSKFILKKYNWDDVVDKTISLYKRN